MYAACAHEGEWFIDAIIEVSDEISEMKFPMLMFPLWNKITWVSNGFSEKIGVGFSKEMLFVDRSFCISSDEV